MKYDLEQIRSSLGGQAVMMLESIGIERSLLDGKGHPCPKCGGRDRFSLIDADRGAVLCRKCFNKKNGDIFAAVQWWTGCEFKEAIEKVLNFAGIESAGQFKQKKGPADPTENLEFLEWNDRAVQPFIKRFPPITAESILANGGRRARYRDKYPAIAFPVIGGDLDLEQQVGWVVCSIGLSVPIWKDGTVEWKKRKLTAGSSPGLVGSWAVERIFKRSQTVKRIIKVEGITDLLSLWSAMNGEEREENLVITNANGAMEAPKWMPESMMIGTGGT